VYGWTPDEINRRLTLTELMCYHKFAVESQRKEREEIAMLTAITMNGKLGEYLSKNHSCGSTTDQDDGTPDIQGFRALCGPHIKTSKET